MNYLPSQKRFLGIDPGFSGALAFYSPKNLVCHNMPLHPKRRQVNGVDLSWMISHSIVDLAIIEEVGAMPKDGRSSAFKFGTSYGIVIGVLETMEIPYVRVSPAVWKNYFGLSSVKSESTAFARKQFPKSTIKNNGQAEAALIALYGERHFKQVKPK